MARVTTQAPERPQAPNVSIDQMINSLSFDLVHHAKVHSGRDVFDPTCGECIYWAVKVGQRPELWHDYYLKRQAQYLKQLPLEVINHAVQKVAPTDSTGVVARPMTSQEYLQVVNA